MIQLYMPTAHVVEMSVTVNKSPIQEYTHLDDHIPLTRDQAFFFLSQRKREDGPPDP